MRSAKAMLVAALISILALTIPRGVAAQHARYKLIDLGTLGALTVEYRGSSTISMAVQGALR
jgi:hypothetical protein